MVLLDFTFTLVPVAFTSMVPETVMVYVVEDSAYVLS
jgi:hypothetical protein